MDSRSHDLTVLLDKATLQCMRFIEMVSRIDQLRATGRYQNIHYDYRQSEVVAEVLA